jgi:hypothetical protein
MPFDEVAFTLNLKDGSSAAVGAEYSGQAQSLYQLEFGVTTALNILNRFGAGEGVISNGAISKSTFDHVARKMGQLMQFKDCANQVFSEQTNAGSLMSACFDPDKIVKVFGWKGLLIAPAMVAGPVVNFFRSEFNALGDLLNDRDRYAVVVKYKKKPVEDPMAKFVGEWHVHGSTVTYRRNMTGTEVWDEGPCNYTQMCTAYATLRLTLNPNGVLFVEILNVDVRDSQGNPRFEGGEPELMEGTAYSAVYEGPGHLRRIGSFANGNLCGKGASAEARAKCGA